MRGLFIDIDGFLHPASQIADIRHKVTSDMLPAMVRERKLFRWVPLLSRALEEHDDVCLIVHSNWKTIATNEQLKDFLGPLGPRYIGTTDPTLSRYEGILAYVESHGMDTYRIGDDAVDDFPAGLPELLLSDPELGLSEGELVIALSDWLARTAPVRAPVPYC